MAGTEGQPAWSPYRILGCFHNDRTLCVSCHPTDCPAVNCCGFWPSDVTEGHVGASCDGCGKQLLDACGRPA